MGHGLRFFGGTVTDLKAKTAAANRQQTFSRVAIWAYVSLANPFK
jgi:hypothetical protein